MKRNVKWELTKKDVAIKWWVENESHPDKNYDNHDGDGRWHLIDGIIPTEFQVPPENDVFVQFDFATERTFHGIKFTGPADIN